MKKRTASIAGLIIVATLIFSVDAKAKGDDFNAVVKMIEQFYHVKHQGIPLLARAGMKTATTIARIKGGTAKRVAEAGTIKLAVFEEGNFKSADGLIAFRSSLNNAMAGAWTPFVQTLSAPSSEQTYIFLREAGDKFHVLVITIEETTATVVQMTVSPKNLALLMRDPENMGHTITEEATIVDP
jgi:hypothetical protein